MTSKRQAALDARDEVYDELRLTGLKAALRRAVSLLNNDAISPTAHAALVRAMFAAGGLMTPGVGEEVEKEGHELSPEELKATIARLKAKGYGQEPSDGSGGDAGAFG